jgi:hypothetical protein
MTMSSFMVLSFSDERSCLAVWHTYANSTITIIAMIPYFIFYGFNHWWFIAGLFFFLVASTIGKVFKLPVYKKIIAIDNGGKSAIGSIEKVALAEERRKLQIGNLLHALSCVVFVVLMVIQFIVH